MLNIGLQDQQRAEEDRMRGAIAGASPGPHQRQRAQGYRQCKPELPHFPGGQRKEIDVTIVLIRKSGIVHASKISKHDAAKRLARIPSVAEQGVDLQLLEVPFLKKMDQLSPAKPESGQGSKDSRRDGSYPHDAPALAHRKEGKNKGRPDLDRRPKSEQEARNKRVLIAYQEGEAHHFD